MDHTFPVLKKNTYKLNLHYNPIVRIFRVKFNSIYSYISILILVKHQNTLPKLILIYILVLHIISFFIVHIKSKTNNIFLHIHKTHQSDHENKKQFLTMEYYK